MNQAKPKRIPGYRRQRKPDGTVWAFVEIDGRRIYLGRYDTPESREKYHRTLAEWTAAGYRLPVNPHEITVVELVCAFWQHAKQYYRHADGSPTSEQHAFQIALRPLQKLYGRTLASEFGPKALKAVRQRLIELDLCRSTVNKSVGRIRFMFRWACENELIAPEVYHGLQAVSGLKQGRSDARETLPVRPVPLEHVNAIKPFVSAQVWAIIELQLLTGARSGELLPLRALDIDMSGNVWRYKPVRHKNSFRGHERIIYLGPRSQETLKPFLRDRSVDAYLFSPADAERERRKQQLAKRTTPMSCGNKPGSNRVETPRRKAGERYTTDSYRRAVRRACKKAGIPRWHPHQLRHSAGTELRKQFGLETARVILGHRTAAITETYAEMDNEKAIEVMAQVG